MFMVEYAVLLVEQPTTSGNSSGTVKIPLEILLAIST